MTALAVVAAFAAAVLAGLRWLRVAQREHYLPGSCSRFARRWWMGLGFNRLLTIAIVINVVLAAVSPFFAILAAVPLAVGPFGLRVRGTVPGPVVWTRRLRTLAAIWAGLTLAFVAIGWLVGEAAFTAVLAAALTPAIIDVALAVAEPIERRLAQPFVDQAAAKLRSVGPTVVAITGSYGKTSTKGYAAHLIAGSRSVMPSPASFNNNAGLARAINENLALGTEVFVAEMGTYGPGEIAAMCEWVRPSIAAITAIGPVHLERMKSEDNIVAAKSEIFGTASTAVLNVDDDRLAALADRLAGEGKTVVRVSGGGEGAASASVVVRGEGTGLTVDVEGREIAAVDGVDAPAVNVAVAVALARAVGVSDEIIAGRIRDLPRPANRLAIAQGSTGFTAIDDTYNSNPAGTVRALAILHRHAERAARSVVVTPGMIELGDRQDEENRRFAAAASEIATDVVVVGGTNRKALEAGAHEGRARVVLADDHAAAIAWVRENAGPGDVVLYENQLPDHFP